MMATVNTKPRKKKGSESRLANFGKIVGTGVGAVAGGIASLYSGGTLSVPAIAAGASIGGAAGQDIGGTVGKKTDPTRRSDTKSIQPLNAARVKMPEVQYAALQQAKGQLGDLGLGRDEYNALYSHLSMAQDEIKRRI